MLKLEKWKVWIFCGGVPPELFVGCRRLPHPSCSVAISQDVCCALEILGWDEKCQLFHGYPVASGNMFPRKVRSITLPPNALSAGLSAVWKCCCKRLKAQQSRGRRLPFVVFFLIVLRRSDRISLREDDKIFACYYLGRILEEGVFNDGRAAKTAVAVSYFPGLVDRSEAMLYQIYLKYILVC